MAGEFGVVLRHCRRQKNLTLRELEKLTGVCYTQLADYESGRYLPRIEQLKKIASQLGIRLTDLATIIKWEREFRRSGRSISAEQFLAAWLMNTY
jgi:transcriptional regulator with XRE-family HTH domain